MRGDVDLQARLDRPGPKRLLAVDGGGLRGLIALGYLSRIESILRARHEDPDLVLSDYFDLIGGTSTGSIIAAGLALGWPTGRLLDLYRDLGPSAFRLRRSLASWIGLRERFDDRPLATRLATAFGDRRLDSADFRTGLLVIAKRADTGSVWVLSNVPRQRFFEANRSLRVSVILRASAAAPTYFAPQWIDDVGNGESGVFVDGGVSMHGSPALQCLMASTIEGFGLCWPLGEDRLLLCSVGTGWHTAEPDPRSLLRYGNLGWARLMITQLLRDAKELNETLLQWMSEGPTHRPIDLRIGTLEGQSLGPAPLLSYRRWDVDLDVEPLAELGLRYDAGTLEGVRDMAAPSAADELEEIGVAAAAAHVRGDHFPPGFDLGPAPRPAPGAPAEVEPL